MTWTENSVLINYSETTPCKDIFQAVCDELGRHYEKIGLKYSRSRPKIVYKDKEIKLEICFWSSASNTPGEYVNLEILPNFYSIDLAKKSKTRGFLFGHTGINNIKYTDDKKKVRIIQIFGDVVERIDEYSHESVIRYNHNCNVYGLDKERFDKIVEFIDSTIISWIDKIKTEQGVRELSDNPTDMRIWALNLNGKGGNSDFVNYVKTKFPDIDLTKWQENKTNAQQNV
jgi:hypothetical protein